MATSKDRFGRYRGEPAESGIRWPGSAAAASYSGYYLFWTAAIDRGKPLLRSFSGGVLIGLAMLVRPAAIAVAVVLASLLWLWRKDLGTRRRLSMVLLLAGNLVAVFPWHIWTLEKGIGFIPLSTGGPGTVLDGMTFAVRPKEWRQGVSVPRDVENLMRQMNGRESEIREGLNGALRVILEEARESPSAMAKLMLLKASRCWYATDSQRFERMSMLLQVPFLLVFFLSSWIAWRRGGLSRRLVQGVWLLVVYFWCISTITYSLVRYMVPAIGLLFVLPPVAWQASSATFLRRQR